MQGPRIFQVFKIDCLWVTVLEHSLHARQFHSAHKDMEFERQAMYSYPYVKLEPIRGTVMPPQ